MTDLIQTENRLSRLEAGVSEVGERLQEAEGTVSDLLEPGRPWLPPVDQVIDHGAATGVLLPFDVVRHEFADVEAGEPSDLAYAMYLPCLNDIVRIFDVPLVPLDDAWPWNTPSSRRKGDWFKLPHVGGYDAAYDPRSTNFDLVIVEKPASASSRYVEMTWYIAAYLNGAEPPPPSGTTVYWRVHLCFIPYFDPIQRWHGAFFHDIQRGYADGATGPDFVAGPGAIQAHAFCGAGTVLEQVSYDTINPGQDNEYVKETLSLHNFEVTIDTHGAFRRISHGDSWSVSFPVAGQCPMGPTGYPGRDGEDADCDDPGVTGPVGSTGPCGLCDVCDYRGGYSDLNVLSSDHVIWESWTNLYTGETEDNHLVNIESAGEVFEGGWAMPFNHLSVMLGSGYMDNGTWRQTYYFQEEDGQFWQVEALFTVNVQLSDVDGFEDYVKEVARGMGVICA